MSLLPIPLPEYGKPVTAAIKHCSWWKLKIVSLVAVDETDCDWRFVEDNEELSPWWDVIYWEYQ